MLANKFNYSLVYVESTGTNAFFINNDKLINNNLKFENINNIEKLYVSFLGWQKNQYRKCSNSIKWYNFDEAINISQMREQDSWRKKHRNLIEKERKRGIKGKELKKKRIAAQKALASQAEQDT